MKGLVHTKRIWPTVAAAALLAAAPAAAHPGPIDPAASPAALSGFGRPAARPLPLAVPPANDAFADAEVAASLPFASAASTGEATSAADDPFCARDDAATVWYVWEASTTGWVTANTFGSDYDTILSAYTGAPGSLSQVACNDDAAGPQSEIAFLAEWGREYYFMAAGAVSGGNLAFSLDVLPPLPLVPVRAGRAVEITPASGPNHLAWAEGSLRRFRYWRLYLSELGDPKEPLNELGTHGFAGGFDGTTFVYQEVRRSQSDLRLYQAARRTGLRLRGVNTRHWEWHPTISGDWVLFGRRDFRARVDKVILENRRTGRTIVLDRLPRAGGSRIAEAGQVNGDYATWYRCTPACDVFLYDITERRTTRIPNPARRQHYDPSVASDGTVYFVRSGRGCGAAVQIVRHPPGGPSTALASLGAGRDSFHTYFEDYGDGTGSVFTERVRCANGDSDVFRIFDP